jgi:hypothetical protein
LHSDELCRLFQRHLNTLCFKSGVSGWTLARLSELYWGMSGLSRKLKIDSRFTPCSVEDGDELFPNGIFVFNITKMTEYIMHSRIPFEEIQVRDFSRGASKFKEEHLAAVDITRPIIVAEISPGRYNVIDGNHRIEKAR